MSLPKSRGLPIPDATRGTTPPAIMVINVHGVPRAQPRADACAVYSKKKKKWVSQTYSVDTADGWKSRVYLAAKSHPHRPSTPWNGAVQMDIDVYLPRPEKLDKKLKASPCRQPAIGKPDDDNLKKAIQDAITEARLWSDDCRVYAGCFAKWYHEVGAQPGAVITIGFEEWPR